jgi:hypothetical protein
MVFFISEGAQAPSAPPHKYATGSYNRTQLVVYLYHKHCLGPDSESTLG